MAYAFIPNHPAWQDRVRTGCWAMAFWAWLLVGIGYAAEPMAVGVWLEEAPSSQSKAIFAPVVDALGRVAGCDFQLKSFSGPDEGLKAFGDGRVDLLITGPRSYLTVKRQHGALLLAEFFRPDNFSVLAVRGNSNIRHAFQLKNQAVALPAGQAVGSSLAPMHLMLKLGLDPYRDLSVVRFDLDYAWRSFRRGGMAAIATSQDRLKRLMAEDSGVSRSTLRILGRGPDLPGDVLMVRADADPAIVSRIRGALRSHAGLFEAILRAGMGTARYGDDALTTAVSDRDYDGLLTMMAELGQVRFATLAGRND